MSVPDHNEQLRNEASRAMQAALQQVDAARDALDRERQALAAERDVVAELHRHAEREGQRMANAYLDERRAQLMGHAQHEAILDLAVRHLRAGRAAGEVAAWLHAGADLMDLAGRIVQRRTVIRAVTPGPHNAKLNFSSAGRGGTVHYSDGRTSFSMWWELAMHPALAIIGVPERAAWERNTGLPLNERASALEWIAQRSLQDQVPSGGTYSISEDCITQYRA